MRFTGADTGSSSTMPQQRAARRRLFLHGRLARYALLIAWTFAGVTSAKERQVALPPPELTGRWRGQGRIVSDWTSVQSLEIDVGILPDGTVVGRIGHAQIAGGFYEESNKKRTKRRGFALAVNLDGELLGDGVMRRGFRLELSSVNGRLICAGASNGERMMMGAWRDAKRRCKALQVRSVSLIE